MTNAPDNLAPAPPHDVDAEAAYLGSLVTCDDPAARRRMRRMLRPADFFDAAHAKVFEVAAGMVDAGRPLDAVTLAAAMRDAGDLAEIGGAATLVDLFVDRVFTWRHGETYGAKVAAYAARRRGIRVADRLSRDLYQPADDEAADARIQRAIGELWQTASPRSKVEVFSLEDILHQWVEDRQAKRSPALLSGCDPLDQYAGIFAFGKYTVLAGRPSMGKSTALRWLLGQWARAGTPVGLVACEEDRKKIAGNYLSADTSIENDHLAYHDLSAGDWAGVLAAVGRMAGWPWYGVDTAFTLNEVATAVEMLATEKKCRVIGVDHIHLIRLEQKTESEQREVKEISQRLKELAKRFDVVLIAAAQLSRPQKQQGIPPPPCLTDLRSSGAIEEHADAAIFLHREDYYRPNGPKDDLCQWIIAKNRNGKRGIRTLRAELKHQRYVEVLAGAFDD
jgi:replicative DNA helicase